MKKLYTLLFTIVLAVCTATTQAQTENCYDQYKKVFDNRGADAVEDGLHKNVILSVKTKTETECYLVDVTVKRGEIVEIRMYFEDGTSEPVIYEFKENNTWIIYNGVSRTRITTNEETIHIFFTNRIKPKKKTPVKAPKPNFELN
jgi:ABC-type transporter MlaC component